jgi:hypothetical protein
MGGAAHDAADEVGCRTRIQERIELMGAHRDTYFHGTVAAYPRDGIQGDEGLVLSGSQERSVHQVWELVFGVSHLQVEETRTLVAAYVLFVTVVAEA